MQGEEVCPPYGYRCLGALGACPGALGTQEGSACPLGSTCCCPGASQDQWFEREPTRTWPVEGERGPVREEEAQMPPGAWGSEERQEQCTAHVARSVSGCPRHIPQLLGGLA